MSSLFESFLPIASKQANILSSQELNQRIHQKGLALEIETTPPVAHKKLSKVDKTVFIGGLSLQSTKESVLKFLKGFGEVQSLSIPTHPKTRNIRGFARVGFAQRDSVERLLSAPNPIIDGVKVGILPWASKKDYLTQKQEACKTRIYVKYQSGITKCHLREFFSQFGSITEIDIRKNHTTEKERCFCFITFEDESSVYKATSKETYNVHGKWIESSVCKPSHTIRTEKRQAEPSDKRDKETEQLMSYLSPKNKTQVSTAASTAISSPTKKQKGLKKRLQPAKPTSLEFTQSSEGPESATQKLPQLTFLHVMEDNNCRLAVSNPSFAPVQARAYQTPFGTVLQKYCL